MIKKKPSISIQIEIISTPPTAETLPAIGPYVASEETQKIFAAYKAEVDKRQLSSSENFDKSILTYSSGGLAISLTFLKDLIPIQKATWSFLLYGSLIFFVSAIAFTITSFLVSYKAQEQSLIFSEKYYIEGLTEFHDKKTWCHHSVKWFNIISGIIFITALIFSSLFVAVNLNKVGIMAEKNGVIKGGYAEDGLPSASMQKIPNTSTVERGAPTPTMQKIPTPAPAAPVPTTSTTTTK